MILTSNLVAYIYITDIHVFDDCVSCSAHTQNQLHGISDKFMSQKILFG